MLNKKEHNEFLNILKQKGVPSKYKKTWTGNYKPDTVVDIMADRIEELETENKNLRHMIIDQISSTGDDPEIMAASRAEWAARALAAEARINELKATLKKLEYWFDTDQEILDVMGNNEKADHMRKLKMIRDALGGDSDE